jgi:hypothetical protein
MALAMRALKLVAEPPTFARIGVMTAPTGT